MINRYPPASAPIPAPANKIRSISGIANVPEPISKPVKPFKTPPVTAPVTAPSLADFFGSICPAYLIGILCHDGNIVHIVVRTFKLADCCFCFISTRK